MAGKPASNRRNALRSTGPTTAAGKAVAAQNAVAHGLRSAAALVPGECPDEWVTFQSDVMADLAPVGAVEHELAARAVGLMWRLRRVSQFEAASVAQAAAKAEDRIRGDDTAFDWPVGTYTGTELALLGRQAAAAQENTPGGVRKRLEQAEDTAERSAETAASIRRLLTAADDSPVTGPEAMAALRAIRTHMTDGEVSTDDEVGDGPVDDVGLRALGVPKDMWEVPEAWGGWTAGKVREAAGLVHASYLEYRYDGPAESVLQDTAAALEAEAHQAEAELPYLRGMVASADRQAEEAVAAARQRAMVPVAEVADRVQRYEAHLSRQLERLLRELDRRQAARAERQPVGVAVLVRTRAADPPAIGAGGDGKG